MTARVLSLTACLIVLCAVSPAEALFRKPDLEKIPVDRLVKNLTEQLEKESKATSNTRYNLARVHAMAYALKTDSCEVTKKREPGEGAWFGFTPGIVPFKAVESTDKAKLEAAMKHLAKAISTYKDLLKDQPNHLPGQLGLAWCLDQSGEKDEAIKAYRDVLEKGWDMERKKKTGPLGGNFITKEAAGYLIPLLSKEKDADEIASIQQRVAILNKLPRPITPIAIPLKDGLAARDLEDKNASVLFDADGTDLKRRWTWITKDAAWLVYVPQLQIADCRLQIQKRPGSRSSVAKHSSLPICNLQSEICNSPQITSGLQLFGNVTFWCFWENGYEALRCLDDNGDGDLTGKELRDLALWHDANGNGITEPGEIRPLSEFGIVGLSCNWQTDERHADRIAFSPRGVRFADGTTRPSFDLILRQR